MQTKVCIVNTSGFFSSYVWMWELNHKEGWVLKNWCFWIVVLEKALESPLDSKEIQPDNPKGNQLWIFIGRTEAEVEALILWPPDVISQLIGKDPEAGKVWGQEKGETGCNGWIASLTQWTSLWETVKDSKVCHTAVHGVVRSWAWLSDWIMNNIKHNNFYGFIKFHTKICIYCIQLDVFVDKNTSMKLSP